MSWVQASGSAKSHAPSDQRMDESQPGSSSQEAPQPAHSSNSGPDKSPVVNPEAGIGNLRDSSETSSGHNSFIASDNTDEAGVRFMHPDRPVQSSESKVGA